MTTVMSLLPGDEVHQGGRSALYIGRILHHPLFPRLTLVIWILDNGTYSLDALDLKQEVGTITASTWETREARLRSALLGGGTHEAPAT
jgi:hypothetical protein